jgi:1-acyl-sn-glycerol-3-phosphate acyltransferase
MSTLRAAAKLLAFIALTLPLMLVQQVLLWFFPDGARVFPHHYHRLLCRLFSIRLNVTGTVPVRGACLVISNHVSWLDVVILSAVMPLSFVAKREVSHWPFFGTLARLQRTVFVDRERRHTTAKVADSVAGRLAAGEAIVLFGEGTSHDGASVLPFKSSLFAAATAPHIGIVPVTLAYRTRWGLPMSRRERPSFAWYGDMDLISHLWNFMGEGPLGVTVIIHEALSVETGLNRKTAADVSEKAIRQGLVAALHGTPDLR